MRSNLPIFFVERKRWGHTQLAMPFIERLKIAFLQFKNARLYPRSNMNLPVQIFVPGSKEPRTDRIGNWSHGGLFIFTKDPLPLDAQIEVEFSIGTQPGSILRLKAQVVRHQSNPLTQEVEGMGLMFTDFTQSGLSILRDVLAQAWPEPKK